MLVAGVSCDAPRFFGGAGSTIGIHDEEEIINPPFLQHTTLILGLSITHLTVWFTLEPQLKLQSIFPNTMLCTL